MNQHFFILLLYLSVCSSDNADVVTQYHLKIVQAGDSVNFTCVLPSDIRCSVVWVKQRVGEKLLLIAASYHSLDVKYENEFDKHERYFVTKEDGSFNLSITKTAESDTATYYCVIYAYNFVLGDSTDLIVKDGQLSVHSDPQRPATDPDIPWRTIALVLITSNCLSVIVIIILGSQLYKPRQKDGIPFIVLDQLMADDTSTTVNYTAYHKRL